jgi:hypothetical protein
VIDRGLLVFALILSTIAIIASIFASNVIPAIFKTEDAVLKTQITFNDSQIQTLDKLDLALSQLKNISNETINLTKNNADNIESITNKLTAINQSLNNK